MGITAVDIEDDVVEEEVIEELVEESEPIPEEDENQDEPEEDDGFTVQIDDEDSLPQEEEDEASKAPSWVRDLRKSHKDQQRENRELKKKLDELQTPAEEVIPQLKAKPTLESADYDTDVYERQLTEWHDAKRRHGEREEQQAAEVENQKQAWQNTLDSYTQKKTELKARDFDDAELVVQDELNNVQQGLILQGADDPALVIYALGKNPKKIKELAALTDPVKFSFAVAKLETKLKVSKRRATTSPERTVTGNSRLSGSVDSNLDRLRAEAAKTGDYTKVTQYKRQKQT